VKPLFNGKKQKIIKTQCTILNVKKNKESGKGSQKDKERAARYCIEKIGLNEKKEIARRKNIIIIIIKLVY
jgi:hypothetical protein